MQLDVTPIHDACRQLGKHYFGETDRWLYDCFDEINANLFDGELPQPLMIPTITAFSRCLGLYANREFPSWMPKSLCNF